MSTLSRIRLAGVVAALILAIPAVAQTVSPISLWTGDGTGNDSIGSNHGTLQNVAFGPGVRGQAFVLNGNNSHVSIPHDPSLLVGGELTLEMWFKREDAWSYGTLIDKRNWATCNYGVIMSQDWGFQLYFDDPDHTHPWGQYEISFSAVPASGVFHHLVGTFRQVDANDVELKTYIDGQLVRADTLPGVLTNSFNAEPLSIGSARNGSGAFFQGLIDEVALYNRALSASDVLSNYVAIAGSITNVPPGGTNPPVYTNANAGLVSLWRADGSGADSAGSNHGTLVGDVSFAGGVSGQAFNFDGANDYLRIPDSATLRITNELTLELWFMRRTDDSFGALIDKRDWSTCNYGFIVSPGWGMQLYYDDPRFTHGWGQYEISFSEIPSAGVFHHLVGTMQQTGSGVELKTYLDGALVKTDTLPGNLGTTWNSVPVAVGAAHDGNGAFFDGLVDEVALYNRALTASEVLSNYTALVSGITNTNPPVIVTNAPGILISKWKGEGDALDSISTNNGTLMNGASFAPGVIGQGFQLDGVDDYVRIPHNPSLNIGNEVTVEMWFRRESATSYGTLFDKRSMLSCNYGVIMSAEWGFQLYFDDPRVMNGNQFEISFSGVPSAGVFHHLAGTMRQVSATHVELKTYIDGQLVRADVLRGNLANTFNSEALAIGSARDGSGAFFHGVIDEVALYSRALTPAEIFANYTAGAAFPQIVAQPQNISVTAGASTSLWVSVIGAAPIQFQWYFDGSALPDATNNSITFADLQAEHVGEYFVVAYNEEGSVTSRVASVALAPDGTAPEFSVAPLAFYSAAPGGSVSMTASVIGTPPLHFQWTLNGVALADATNATLVMSNVQAANAGVYYLHVTNAFGGIASAGSTLNVAASSGATISFLNFSYNAVLDQDGSTLLPSSNGFMAALYVGVASNALVQVGGPASFVLPGRFYGGTRFIDTIAPGTPAFVQVRVWDAKVSDTYEEAAALGARIGSSPVFQVTLGGSIIPPATLASMPSFSVGTGTGVQARRSLRIRNPIETRLIPSRVGLEGMSFVISGTAGLTYAVEASDDLVTWTTIGHVVNNTGAVTFTDSTAAGVPRRFYRANPINP